MFDANFVEGYGRAVATDPTTGDLVVLDTFTGVRRYSSIGDFINTITLDGSISAVSAVACDSAGRILIGGQRDQGEAGNDFAVARYNAGGFLDTTFGNNGVATIDLGSANDAVNGMSLDDQGKILLIGDTFDPSTGNAEVGLARLTSTGLPDITFGDLGTVKGSFSDNDHGLNVVFDGTTGTLVALVTTSDGDRVAYAADGSLVNSFSIDSTIRNDGQHRNINISGGLAVNPSGQILIGAGTYVDTTSFLGGFAVVCYEPDGARNAAFGVDGVATVDLQIHDSAGNYYAWSGNGLTLTQTVTSYRLETSHIMATIITDCIGLVSRQ